MRGKASGVLAKRLLVTAALAAVAGCSASGGATAQGTHSQAAPSTEDGPSSTRTSTGTTPSVPPGQEAGNPATPTATPPGTATGSPSLARSPTAVSAATSHAPDPARCHASELSVAAGEPQAAAGTTTTTFTVTNTGRRTCPVYGYPGAAAYSAGGAELRFPLERKPPEPTTVPLAPQASTTFVTQTGGSGTCSSVAYLLVTPPDETATVKVPVHTGVEGCTVGHDFVFALGAPTGTTPASRTAGASSFAPARPAPPGTANASSTASPCDGSGLTFALKGVSARGHLYQAVNNGPATCSLQGYPNVVPYDAQGGALSGPSMGAPGDRTTTIDLKPGQAAYFVVAAGHDDPSCPKAATLRVSVDTGGAFSTADPAGLPGCGQTDPLVVDAWTA
jgi:hypothetical protein